MAGSVYLGTAGSGKHKDDHVSRLIQQRNFHSLKMVYCSIMELMLKCGFQNIRENFMEIKNNCQKVKKIVQEIKSAAEELQLKRKSIKLF